MKPTDLFHLCMSAKSGNHVEVCHNVITPFLVQSALSVLARYYYDLGNSRE